MSLRKRPPEQPRPVLIVLGAAGNLAHTKLSPALDLLATKNEAGTFGDVSIVLADRSEGLIRARLILAGVVRWFRVAGMRLIGTKSGVIGDLTVDSTYDEVRRVLSIHLSDSMPRHRPPVLFYFAVPPDLIKHVATKLAAHNLLSGPLVGGTSSRLIVEKPFGTSGSSAEELWALLTGPTSTGALNLDPDQICLVDHYLYKSMVDQILDYRQNLQADEWTAETVDHVQITVAECEDIQKEPRTYNVLGAIGDMIQNHLLQLLCLTAMDLPARNADGTIDYDQVIANGVDILREVQPYKPDEGGRWFVLGQYQGGTSPRLTRETFAALRLYVNTSRWRGVPFFLRTGKGMSRKFAAITVAFEDGSKTVFRIQPKPAVMHWDGSQYVRADGAKSNDPPREEDPHARILEELLNGNLRRAVSRDWTAAAWEVVKEPHTMVAQREVKLFEYPPGTDGPGEADRLSVEPCHKWLPVGHSLPK